jgi:DNA-binding transcriptional ArsR family regulator
MPALIRTSPDQPAALQLRISDVALAQMLLEPETLRLLSVFIGQEQTASQAAKAIKVPLTTLMYRIKRLEKAGLLVMTRLERRNGSPIRHYRSVSESFFIPYDFTPFETPEFLLAYQHAPRQKRLEQALVRAGRSQFDIKGRPVFGVCLVQEGDRLVMRNGVDIDSNWNFLDATAPAIIDFWAENIYLDFVEAKKLQQEMCELLSRYRNRPGAQNYILRLAMAPSVQPNNDDAAKS